MDRRLFIKQTGALAIAGAVSAYGVGAEKKKPNVVLIMADDLGWSELGCYGQEKIMTPNIDKLAKEGMKLMQYYAGSGVCAPTRCNLMTGKHGGHAYIRDNGEMRNKPGGIWGGQTPLPLNEPGIAKTLKKQGYATGCFGKWGLGGMDTTGDPLSQGFDRFYGFNCQRHAHNLYPKYLVSDKTNEPLKGNMRKLTGETYGPQRVADEMLEFVKKNKDKPFFVYYPTVIPHLALQVPEKYVEMYEGKWDETPYKGGSYLPHPKPKACYAGMITFMDEQIGRLMSLLKELGLDEDTIVIFTSDNGTTYLKGQVDYEFFKSVGPLKGLKGSLYEGGIRMPFIARWPGKIKPGTTDDYLLSAHYDMPATIADIAGTEFDEGTDGVSILPTLLGRKSEQKKHPYLFWDFAGYGGQLAVRMGKWKGIKRNLRKDPNAPLELYDLEKDIGEKNNVVAENPEVAAEINKIMIAARTKPRLKRFSFGKYSDSN